MQPTPTRSPTANLVTPGPTSDDDAGDLVAGHHREDRLAPALADLVDVGVADAGELDVDQHVVLADRAALDGGALQRSLGGGRGVRGNSGHAGVLLAGSSCPACLRGRARLQPARRPGPHPGHGFAYVRCAYHWRGQDAVRTTGNTGRHGRTGPKPAQRRRALDPRAELSEFLRTRRARLKPEDVGLPDFGRHRRVPGLRREELAQLAGVSVAYYTRLEQGNGRNVSAEVLDVDRPRPAADRRRARPSDPSGEAEAAARRSRRPAPSRCGRRCGSCWTPMDGVPAYVVGRRSDILAWNRMAAARLRGLGPSCRRRSGTGRGWCSCGPTTGTCSWTGSRRRSDIVCHLRMDAGCHPDDPRLSALVGELSVKSEEFRRLWATHDVKEKSHGVKQLRHPLVGELTLTSRVVLARSVTTRAVAGHVPRGAGFAVGGGAAAAGRLGRRRAAVGGERDGSVRRDVPGRGRPAGSGASGGPSA